nr:hypothetical protein Iba_chr15aCG12750 [Ipomoea batatas]
MVAVGVFPEVAIQRAAVEASAACRRHRPPRFSSPFGKEASATSPVAVMLPSSRSHSRSSEASLLPFSPELPKPKQRPLTSRPLLAGKQRRPGEPVISLVAIDVAVAVGEKQPLGPSLLAAAMPETGKSPAAFMSHLLRSSEGEDRFLAKARLAGVGIAAAVPPSARNSPDCYT